jgi:hypothetical protein
MFGRPGWQWFVAAVGLSVISALPIPILRSIAGILGAIAWIVVIMIVVRAVFSGSGTSIQGTAGHDRALRNRDGSIGPQ